MGNNIGLVAFTDLVIPYVSHLKSEIICDVTLLRRGCFSYLHFELKIPKWVAQLVLSTKPEYQSLMCQKEQLSSSRR